MLHFTRTTATVAMSITLAAPAYAMAAGPDSLMSPDAVDANRDMQSRKPYIVQDARTPDRRELGSSTTGARSSESQSGRTVEAATRPVVTVLDARPDGFDWGDAGIGAAGGLAIVTIAGVVGLVATQRRRSPRLPAATR